MEWQPAAYANFSDLRLRPALDLMAQVPALPRGDVIDLGCGNGQVGAALKARFGRPLIGVDSSETMLDAAAQTGTYDRLENCNIADWQGGKPALIFSNAALHWLPDHHVLFPRLARMLPAGGVLAVQMPRQFMAPSHRVLRTVAERLFPDRFDFSNDQPAVAASSTLAVCLRAFGQLNIWETSYLQRLEGGTGHPVRRFTSSTAARPILQRLNEAEQARFLQAYDEALLKPYPLDTDGAVDFPFLRQFIVLALAA